MRTAPSAPGTVAPPSDEPESSAARPERRWMVAGGLGLLFVAVTIVMAFPSITRWRTATPGDYADQYLYQYLLKWDFHAMFGAGRSVFDAPFFWPQDSTLLYSDTVLAVAPLAGALAAVTGWLVAFNLLYVGGWVASLGSTYVLARWVGASRAGAVLAGLVFTFAAVRLGHYGHFQLLFAFFIPLTLWLLLRLLTEGGWWQPLALGASCAAVFLNSGYTAVALFPSLAVVGLGWLLVTRLRPGWRAALGIAVAAGIALALIWPVLSEYRSLGDFLRRDYLPEEAVTPRDFLAPASGSLLYGGLERWAGARFEKRLFPGFVAMALAAVGAVSLVLHRRSDRPRRRRGRSASARPDPRRRGLVLVIVSTVPTLLLAFGRHQEIFGRRVTMPYAWVDSLPGFQTIRAFGRFAVLPLLALALLAAVGYDRVVRQWPRVVATAVAVVLGVAMLGEYKATVNMSDRIDVPSFTAVNHALAELPDAPVVELPMGRDEAWGFVETPRMLLSTIDWKPRIGGYSGYVPPGYDRTNRLMNSLAAGGPASPEVLDLIDRLGVRYLVIRLAPFDGTWGLPGETYADEGMARTIVRALPPERLEGVTREGAALLVRLRPPSAARP